MGTELKELLLRAGEWAAELRLEQANWNPDTKTLQIQLYSAMPLTTAQQESLSALFCEQFSTCAVEIRVDIPAMAAVAPRTSDGASVSKDEEKLLYGKRIARAEIAPMHELREDSGRVTVEGKLLAAESNPMKKGSKKVLLLLTVTDFSNTIQCKAFVFDNLIQKLEKYLQDVLQSGGYLRVRGIYEYDKFAREPMMLVDDIMSIPAQKRRDTAEQKRVELHLHTQMSAMDGLTNVKDAIQTAAQWGHKAIAITDHGVVQAFPDAYKAGAKNKIKVLFGVEGYLKADSVSLPMEQP